ncbi:MAG TPA: hypothetical protein VJU59_40340, partial [Paraburkholderia sp.]|uniref:hypothetical protein n=1 Tax=Paraburkholderia sp. TaxID=1926495 RepID=UPI002B4872F6
AVEQRNATNNGWITRLMASPPSNGLLIYDTVTLMPKWVTPGGGLTLSAATLDAVPQAWATITGKPTFATVATTGAYADLTGQPTIPAAQVNTDWNAVSGVAQMLNKPTLTSGTVTSVTAGTGLSGGTITNTGTISMPNVGTAGTYSSVTTDAQGRVTAGTSRSINDTPGRALVSSTSATGFQVSSTRTAHVCYEGAISTTSTIGGPAAATVFLETADTNSTTPGDWTTKAQQTNSNTITLAIVLNQVLSTNWSFCRYIPAGKFVRIRVGSVTGTASATINATQQETLL